MSKDQDKAMFPVKREMKGVGEVCDQNTPETVTARLQV